MSRDIALVTIAPATVDVELDGDDRVQTLRISVDRRAFDQLAALPRARRRVVVTRMGHGAPVRAIDLVEVEVGRTGKLAAQTDARPATDEEVQRLESADGYDWVTSRDCGTIGIEVTP